VQTLEGTGSPLLEAGQAAAFAAAFDAVVEAIGQALVGKPDAIRLSLICLLSEGHLLLEDVPGTGKTTLAKSLAATIHGTTSRIQFTPDLLPSDVTGVTIYDQSVGAFEFHPGPVFASIVLADEINRASPKTQSALLEVMEESAVTVDGVTRPVGTPFMVIGTQNPIEQAGTYRLPEAQLDRFLLRTGIGHPDTDAALAILGAVGTRASRAQVEPMLSPARVEELITQASRVYVDPSILRYITGIVEGTRAASGVALGVSQRGAIALLRAGKTLAASRGRHFVLPDDIKVLAEPVLAHRISVMPEAEFNGLTAAQVVATVLRSVPPPRSST
jgi:MoxR-like ATPase